MMAEGFESNH